MKSAYFNDDFGFISGPRARVLRLRKTLYNAGMELSAQLPKHLPWMITLTYRDVLGWEKNHIQQYLQRVRVWLGRRGHKLHYVWCAELQKRGAVHYHVIVWLPPGFSLPHSDKRGWWRHGFTQHAVARKGVGYLMKYTSKGDCGDVSFPRGCRIYGFSRSFPEVSRRVAFYRAPRWLRDVIGRDCYSCYLVRKSGFWLDKDTGECFDTPLQWQFLFYDKRRRGIVFKRSDAPLLPLDRFLAQVDEELFHDEI